MVWEDCSAGVEEQGRCGLGGRRNLGELIGSKVVSKAANRASGKQITLG